MPKEQKFEIGYHLNTWDFRGSARRGISLSGRSWIPLVRGTHFQYPE